ncbi:hypothetical protein AA101099_0365 [Neoasaia chiangmaiensis NBRC 101099]|uniref:Uncharacterized protein n=1 Tax=Neoasaia chiangmaiensis TaxID=320497 RepID=A0A1U9KRM0_9PROT|nr:chaperone modulator CbpM [Neoasaia chiangmaiensis]AQS88511.1 hypothetical protein A0U93_11835 [Neoasaia chiangmaiensis]GBR36445.1 hypothetical protein AA101099_0365 [Neoasaia chiangmaiensis NBRC 101099]GEN15340.1 hypothetical protein NCH01_17710 [Neoasaia chiangmaiensis]
MSQIVTIEIICRRHQLEQQVIQQWIARDWLRPDPLGEDDYAFQDIDQARVSLLVELRDLEIGDSAMPVVLSLLDQLYDARRLLGRLRETLATAPAPVREMLGANRHEG